MGGPSLASLSKPIVDGWTQTVFKSFILTLAYCLFVQNYATLPVVGCGGVTFFGSMMEGSATAIRLQGRQVDNAHSVVSGVEWKVRGPHDDAQYAHWRGLLQPQPG